MAPRKKAVEPTQATPAQTVAIDYQGFTDEQLLQRYLGVKDWVEAETKRFSTHVAPYKTELEAIENQFLERLNQRGADSTKTDSGAMRYWNLHSPTGTSGEATCCCSTRRKMPLSGTWTKTTDSPRRE
jgi:hypothetical protein